LATDEGARFKAVESTPTKGAQSMTNEETLPRVIWKGAIAFGLVHVPVALYSATQETSLDFDWLDQRSMDPVGYQRINKVTGKVIEKEHVVKGLKYAPGKYVVFSDQEIRASFPKATQTVEIESFVKAADVPLSFFEKPYYVAPINRGAKVFTLLRETLVASSRIGIARVVISNKQHLAALYPQGKLLVLNLLRWGEEVRAATALLSLESLSADVALKASEKKMAAQLVADLAAEWNPDAFKDDFKSDIMKLLAQRVKAGDTATVTTLTGDPAASGDGGSSADIIDLTDLLRRSLGAKKASKGAVGAALADGKTAAVPIPIARKKKSA